MSFSFFQISCGGWPVADAGVVTIGATVVVGLFLSGAFDDPEAAQIVSDANNSLTSQGASSQADDLRSRIKPSSLPNDLKNSMVMQFQRIPPGEFLMG